MARAFFAILSGCFSIGGAFRIATEDSLAIGADELSNVSASHPPCPCTIYNGFCSKRDLGPKGKYPWGIACVTGPDSLITMPWMVQCVPGRNGAAKYKCPKMLPEKCDPSNVEDPCDTSMLAECGKDVCHAGFRLKKNPPPPRFCNLDRCTQSECCERCPAGCRTDPKKKRCVDARGKTVDSSCCETEEAEEMESGELTCSDRALMLATPATLRLGLYASVCKFAATDVNYGSTRFALTSAGATKICSDECQSDDELTKSLLAEPKEDIFSRAELVAGECPDQPALQASLSPVGMFAATAAMDKIFMHCRNGGAVEATGEEEFYDKAVFGGA